MINLDINLQSRKLLVTRIVTIMNKNYILSLSWSLKLPTMVLATNENWSLKICYLDFDYQDDLVTKLVFS